MGPNYLRLGRLIPALAALLRPTTVLILFVFFSSSNTLLPHWCSWYTDAASSNLTREFTSKKKKIMTRDVEDRHISWPLTRSKYHPVSSPTPAANVSEQTPVMIKSRHTRAWNSFNLNLEFDPFGKEKNRKKTKPWIGSSLKSEHALQRKCVMTSVCVPVKAEKSKAPPVRLSLSAPIRRLQIGAPLAVLHAPVHHTLWPPTHPTSISSSQQIVTTPELAPSASHGVGVVIFFAPTPAARDVVVVLPP
jgi:hypothetical protein